MSSFTVVTVKNNTPLVVCGHCKGSGKVALGTDMMATLKALRTKRAGTTEEIAKAIKWEGHISAINNRLEFLRMCSLVTRSRIGRQWRYEAV